MMFAGKGECSGERQTAEYAKYAEGKPEPGLLSAYSAVYLTLRNSSPPANNLTYSSAKSAEKDRPELPEPVSLNSNGFERAFLLLFLCALRTAMPRYHHRLRRFNAEAQRFAEICRGFFFSAFLCALRVSALKLGVALVAAPPRRVSAVPYRLPRLCSYG